MLAFAKDLKEVLTATHQSPFKSFEATYARQIYTIKLVTMCLELIAHSTIDRGYDININRI